MYGKVFLKPCCEPSQPASLPLFQRQQVEGGRTDGYWLETFPFSTSTKTCPDLVGYGLGFKGSKSNVKMFKNPYADKDNRHVLTATICVLAYLLVAGLRRGRASPSPNWSSLSPCTTQISPGTGSTIVSTVLCAQIVRVIMLIILVIISDMYGPSMDDIWPNGGRVNWLENTGDPNCPNWTRRTIGRSPGMHRLKAGHFTRRDRVQICAAPVIVASSDLTTPTPVIIFTAPDDPQNTKEDWPSEIFTSAHLVHEMVVVPAEETGMLYDQIILAGRDGVNLFWFDGNEWQTFSVGQGCSQTPGNPYWGSGNVAVGRVDKDYAGYIASAEVVIFLSPRPFDLY